MSSKKSIFRMVFSAMFLSLALVLPLLTGQIQQVGNALCPMHFPILLCGFICGPWYGMAIGIIAPVLRFIVFGMPPLMPIGISMCFELASYGFVAGMLYKILPKKKQYIYFSLILSMLFGRIIWGISRLVLYGLGKSEFGWTAFFAGAFTNAVPGIILQIAVVPLLVIVLEKFLKRKQ